MKSIKFCIDSDGDFSYEVLFTTVIHRDVKVLEKKMIENMRNIQKSFHTSRKYLESINDCMGHFLKAYDTETITSYYDKKEEDVWFVRSNGKFSFSFHVDNGNQSISILEDVDIFVKEADGGFEIIEKS